MSDRPGGSGPALYLIMCAAPPTLDWPRLVYGLQQKGWSVHAVPTPTAGVWVDAEELAEATGHAVRSHQRLPNEDNELPPADAVLVAPATFNTINKWAAGISDTFALGLLNELLGAGVPMIVAAYCKSSLASHPAYRTNLALLRRVGVTILEGEESIQPTRNGFRWQPVIAALTRIAAMGP